MSIIKDIREKFVGFIGGEQKITGNNRMKPEDQDTGNLGHVVAPIYQEIPPEPKAGQYLKEGMRSWGYIAISAIADEISTMCLSLYKRVGDGTEWKEIFDNPKLALINHPNPFQTKIEFFWLISAFLLSEGEAPVLLNKAKNPTSMILLNPAHLKIVYDKDKIIGGYKYQRTDGTTATFDADLIMFLKLPNWENQFRGLGVSGYIKQTLDLDNFIEEYLRIFFYNNATPSAVLETKNILNDEVIERLKKQFKKRHQGIKNSHKLSIFEDGLTWKNVGDKLSELDTTKIEKSLRDKILSAFKVPKSVLGLVEDVNRANGENADRVFARRAVKPKLLILEEQLNEFLLSAFDDGNDYWFEFENPVKEDDKLIAETRQVNINSGVRTVNEYREEDGLEPIEAETEPVKEPAEGEKEVSRKFYHKNPKNINRIRYAKVKAKTVNPKEEKKEQENPFLEMCKEVVGGKYKREYTKTELDKFHTDKVMFSDKIEANFVEDLNKNMDRIGKEIIAQIPSKKSVKNKKVVFTLDTEKEIGIMAELSTPYIEESIVKESILTFALLGVDDSLDTQDIAVNEYITDSTLKLGKSSTATTVDGVNSILTEWAKDPDASISDLKKLLNNFLHDIKRSEMIARTEVSRATGFAQISVYKEVGAFGKQWITARDEKVCEFCGQLDKRVTAVESDYFKKGDTLVGADGGVIKFNYGNVPAQPLHPNCRCDMIAVFAKTNTMAEFRKKNDREVKRVEAIEARENKINERENELDEDIKELEKIKK